MEVEDDQMSAVQTFQISGKYMRAYILYSTIITCQTSYEE
ncbi:unnamed protein product, partial [Litomosoides sigmodontis]